MQNAPPQCTVQRSPPAGVRHVSPPDVQIQCTLGTPRAAAEGSSGAGVRWGYVSDVASAHRDLGSFHSLRHFVASVAVSSVPLPVVSKVLGHRKGQLTADLYTHLLDSDAGRVAVAVSVAVNRGRKSS